MTEPHDNTAVRAFAELAGGSLDTVLVGREINVFAVLDSTNTYALEHGADGHVYVADRQTMGRGRQGRSWHSAPGLGLWFTVALDGPTEGLTFAAALSVRAALRPQCEPKIKWPNDVLIHGKKVCGILTEHRDGRTALGIGINVHHARADFPPELQAKAGSLATETECDWNRSQLLRDVLTQLDRHVMLLRDGKIDDVRAQWAQACDLIGRRIEHAGAIGTVTEIDRYGALIFETHEGQQRILAGDIALLDGV